MRILKQISRTVKFTKNLYKEKGTVLSLLESGNIPFVRFATPGHFYSPIPDLTTLKSDATVLFDTSAETIPSIDLNEDKQIQLTETFSNFYNDLPFSDQPTEQLRYFFDNAYFSYGDGVILYAFLRNFRPKRVIEVGSGYSSALMLDINDMFLHKEVEFTFIEPFPDRLLKLLRIADHRSVCIEKKPVQEVEMSLFSSLEENDILFIDSSHVGKLGSDVLHILFNIIPQLNQGVIIHFHDILWPFEYPEIWLEGGRAWNEAYFLRAFLINNTSLEIVYFNSYMATHHSSLLVETMPKMLEVPTSRVTPVNTSLWLRVLAD